MQKINVLSIVGRHLRSLSDGRGRLLWTDLVTFYGFPLVAGALFYIFGWCISREALGLSITVFSVFAALLLSVQVTLYSVSLRPLSEPSDPKKISAFKEQKSSRDALIRELNDNISYAILLSVIFITLLLICYIGEWFDMLASAGIIALYVHFFLTLLMIVKRSSIVFSREYESSPG